MPLERISKIVNGGIFVFLCLSCMFAFIFYRQVQDNIEKTSKRHILDELSYELVHSSHKLTENVRLFVLTHDPQYERKYWEILNERTGTIPRFPDKKVEPGRRIALLELIRRYAVSHDDYILARKAMDFSNGLALLEIKAMSTGKGMVLDKSGQAMLIEPDWETARNLVFSEEYERKREQIFRPMQDFFAETKQRTETHIMQAQKDSATLMNLFTVFLVCFGLLVIGASYYINKFIYRPINNIIAFSDTVINGTLGRRLREIPSGEIGKLSHALNLMLDRLENEIVNSSTDPLTRLHNRRQFDKKLDEFRRLHETEERAFSILSIDIDHFKSINDCFGHIPGDEVLQKFAETLKTCCRSKDIVARIGGEEFVILAPAPMGAALRLAERIRRLVEERITLPDGAPVTCSIGVAQYRRGMDLELLRAGADSALYRAKQTGRNKVCVFETDRERPRSTEKTDGPPPIADQPHPAAQA